MRVHNNTDEPVELDYASSQTYNFSLQQGGVLLWQSSLGQRYTPALTSDELEPHRTLVFESSWDGALPGGASAQGLVQAEALHMLTPEPVRITLDISLPHTAGAPDGAAEH